MPLQIVLHAADKKWYVVRQIRDNWEVISSPGIFNVLTVAEHSGKLRDDWRKGHKPLYGTGREGPSTLFGMYPKKPKDFVGRCMYFGNNKPEPGKLRNENFRTEKIIEVHETV